MVIRQRPNFILSRFRLRQIYCNFFPFELHASNTKINVQIPNYPLITLPRKIKPFSTVPCIQSQTVSGKSVAFLFSLFPWRFCFSHYFPGLLIWHGDYLGYREQSRLDTGGSHTVRDIRPRREPGQGENVLKSQLDEKTSEDFYH